MDDAGEIAAQETYDDSNRRWSISIRRDGHMREAVSGSGEIDFPRLLGWGPTADSLLLERLENGDPVWRLLSLKDGSLGPPMAGTEALDEPSRADAFVPAGSCWCLAVDRNARGPAVRMKQQRPGGHQNAVA